MIYRLFGYVSGQNRTNSVSRDGQIVAGLRSGLAELNLVAC
jgi:hypothetical protein